MGALAARRRISVALGAALGVVGLLTVVASSALAGHFHLYSCTDPISHAPLPTDGWAETPGLVVRAENSCPSSGGIEAYLVPTAPSGISSWTYTAPPGLTITTATVYREGFMNSRARGFWTSPENVENEANYFDVCQGAGTGPEEVYCDLGNVGILRECKPLAFCGPAAYAPNDTLVVPATHLPSRKLAFDVHCLQQGCNGYEDMRSADIVLTQTAGPTAVATDGSLPAASTLHGVVDIVVTATDPAAGVFQAILQSNGRTVAKQVIDANGGKCLPYGEDPDGSEIFLYGVPCPAGVSNIDVPFDSAQLPDGPQQVSVLVTDAAGNTTSILSRSVMVENSGAYLVRVQRERAEQALAARGTCNAQCDDHASLHSANVRLARKPFSRRYGDSGMILAGQLLNHAGGAMGGATVELVQQARYSGARPVTLGRATTDGRGTWRFKVPRGPSRLLTVGYRARSKDAAFATKLEFHESVAARVRLMAPPHARPGSAFVFQGQLVGGYIPRVGALVSLEIRYGGAWREIALLQTNRKGAFAYEYTFAAIGTATYRFRARVPRTVGYPFAGGVSAPTRIHLSG